jgi:hypothetical protein
MYKFGAALKSLGKGKKAQANILCAQRVSRRYYHTLEYMCGQLVFIHTTLYTTVVLILNGTVAYDLQCDLPAREPSACDNVTVLTPSALLHLACDVFL